MGFTEKKYAYGMEDKNWFPTVPATEEDARKQFQNMFDQILKLLNDLISELEDKTTGCSGAEKIGSAAIGGVTGLTVRAQIESLKEQIVGITLNEIPDESLTNSKLSPDIKIGSLAALTTADKSSLQAAINELDGQIGDLSTLNTTLKTSLVEAINELNSFSVTESKIVDEAVSETKIKAGAVTPLKLHDDTTAMIPSLSTAKAIDISKNLNEFVNPGTYVATGNVPGTLASCPTNQVFKMYVNCPAGTSGTVIQTIVQYNGVKFERYYDSSNATWSTWTAQPYIIFGTSATPPAGNYPAGTIYVQYVN